ncbi:MAG: SulP family inorganic anion transporter [Pseudomonadota bacterium]
MSNDESPRGEPAQRTLSIAYFLPAIARLSGYTTTSARRDLVAGITVSALLVPQAVAYAQLAGLPPAAGLYASMVPLLVYAAMGVHGCISIGPVALVSIVVADAIASADTGLTAVTAAAVITVMAGITLFLGGMLRLGFMVRFVSNPVVKGFTAAAAILIVLSQVGGVAGLDLQRGNALTTAQSLVASATQSHAPTLLVSISALAAFLVVPGLVRLGLRRIAIAPVWLPVITKSVPLLVLVVVIVLSALGGWSEKYGIAMVGPLTAELPALTFPRASPDVWWQLLPSAMAIAVIVFVVASGVAGSLADTDETVQPDRDAIGLGAANVAAAVTGGYAVGASFSRSALAAQAGAATPFTLAVTAVLVLLVVLLAGRFFAFLPTGVLGALIISAVWSLIDVRAMRRIWRFSIPEALTLFGTLLGVLLAGLQTGIALGALAGLALYLHGTSRPRVIVEGRLRDSDALRGTGRDDVEAAADNGHLIVRVDEALYFGNAQHVARCMRGMLSDSPDSEWLLLDLKSVDAVDYTALEMLDELASTLDRSGVKLRFIGGKDHVWDALVRFGIVERCGGEGSNFATDEAALKSIARRR